MFLNTLWFKVEYMVAPDWSSAIESTCCHAPTCLLNLYRFYFRSQELPQDNICNIKLCIETNLKYISYYNINDLQTSCI